eukprot:257924_1
MTLRYTIYFDVVAPIVCTLAALSVIWFTYQHISAFNSNEKSKQMSKVLYYGGIVFFINVILYFIINATVLTTILCCNYLYASSFSYVTQFGLMVALLLYRLYFIFENTQFALQKYTICIFSILYISTFVMGHIAAYSRNFLYHTYWHNSVGIYYFMVMGLVICFIFLFLYKLISVYSQVQQMRGSNSKMMRTITTIFLLSTISIFWSAVFAILTSFHQYLPKTDHMIFWWKFIAWIDVYTNFLGILLGYPWFDRYYGVFCGFCHRNCSKICNKMVTISDNKELKMSHVHNNAELVSISPSEQSKLNVSSQVASIAIDS